MPPETEGTSDIARTTGKAIDFARDIGQAVVKYLGGSIEQATGIIEDKLRYIRWERRIRLIDRADGFLRDRDLALPNRPVPLQLLLPLLESGSLEETDSMQDRWAAMLANAGDSAFETEIRRAFVSILEDLTPLDARNLEAMYSDSTVADLEAPVFTASLPDHITEFQEESDHPASDVLISLGNLARLGLVTTAMAWGGYMPYGCVHRTVLGTEFMRSISHPRNDA
jgi:Abortive infection alpha